MKGWSQTRDQRRICDDYVYADESPILISPNAKDGTKVSTAAFGYMIELTRIATPSLAEDHPDRLLTAEEAMESAFQSLAAAAECSGWKPDEVRYGLLHLSLASIQAHELSEEMERHIAEARE